MSSFTAAFAAGPIVLDAGARVAITSSYQVSYTGLDAAGLRRGEDPSCPAS